MEAVARRAKRGFNLIEAAIVLAVVGGVIGAIWVSAANFYENYKVNKTVEGVFSIARNVQNLISFRDASSLAPHYNLTPTLINASVFPKDWVNGSSVKHPLGGNVLVLSLAEGVEFVLYGASPATCIKIVVKAAATASMAGSSGAGLYSRPSLGKIDFYQSSGNPAGSVNNFPVTPAQVAGFCTNGMISNSSYIVFLFGYTRIN